MIVSQINPPKDRDRYTLTQGVIDWSNDNWYQDSANALWFQYVMYGVKDWLACRKRQVYEKSDSSHQFAHMLSSLVETIDLSFHSELKMAHDKRINLTASRKNKTSITLAAKLLFNAVDHILVSRDFFTNDGGACIQINLRESDKMIHVHVTRVSKLPMPGRVEECLERLRQDCEVSQKVCESFLKRLTDKSWHPDQRA